MICNTYTHTYTQNCTKSCVDNCFENDPNVNIVYKRIPVHDIRSENILAHVDAACNFIEGVQKQQGKVLVHCLMGISRACTFTIGHLMRENGNDISLTFCAFCVPIYRIHLQAHWTLHCNF